MNSPWPSIPLSDVLVEKKEIPDPLAIESGDIRIVSKIGFETGRIEFRSDGQTKTKMILIRPGDLVVSGINAAKGAIAIYPGTEDQPAAATIHYGTYEVEEKKADKWFLWWLLRSNMFHKILVDRLPGGIKTELRAKRLLTIEISLPSLEEQRRIVAKIEQLATKIEKIKRLQLQVQRDKEALLVAMAHRNDLNAREKIGLDWREIALSEVLTQVSDPVIVEPGKEYPHFGIYSFAKGMFKKPPLRGDVIKATKLYRVHKENFIYARLNAYEGSFGMITNEYDEHFVSNEFPAFECDPDDIIPEFLVSYFRSPKVWEDLKRVGTGIGGGAGNRRIRLKESVFLSLRIWLPPIVWQRKIKRIADKLNKINSDYKTVRFKFEAILPSILDKAFKGEL